MGINVKNKGFSLIEVIVVVAVVGLLVGIATVSLGASKEKTRDTVRKSDVAQVGRFFTLGCYVPQAGGGEYDLNQIIDDLIAKYPEQKKFIPAGQILDPILGTELESYYKYRVTSDGEHCVLYTNLENSTEQVTLEDIAAPTFGGKTGVFEATTEGWNGSKKYYQISK